ncbi:hypothetical protein [Paraburkholderia sediminicola]|uniref:hypothetical protein n=1 Tax=Paraburkholderia sediminicola TaxID=458836 RepID=UPI0038B7E551
MTEFVKALQNAVPCLVSQLLKLGYFVSLNYTQKSFFGLITVGTYPQEYMQQIRSFNRIVRNDCRSIAGHVTAVRHSPRIFA